MSLSTTEYQKRQEETIGGDHLQLQNLAFWVQFISLKGALPAPCRSLVPCWALQLPAWLPELPLRASGIPPPQHPMGMQAAFLSV